MPWKRRVVCAILCLAGACAPLWAQSAVDSGDASAPMILTLKRSLDLALQNSKDIQLAKIQSRVADNSANLTKAEFLPNLYAGSGAGYTYGLPETPGGRPPSIFNLTYTEEVFNGPLRGLAREQQEQAKAQRYRLEETRNNVIDHVATSYLELVKVRHSLELLRKEKDSAEKIVDVTEERQGEGFELPTEVTKAQLTKAQVVQRILQLEGRQDELEVYLRDQLGLAPDQAFEVTPEDLPGGRATDSASMNRSWILLPSRTPSRRERSRAPQREGHTHRRARHRVLPRPTGRPSQGAVVGRRDARVGDWAGAQRRPRLHAAVRPFLRPVGKRPVLPRGPHRPPVRPRARSTLEVPRPGIGVEVVERTLRKHRRSSRTFRP